MTWLCTRSILVINFDDFVANTQTEVERVLSFVGADVNRFDFKPLPPGMKVGMRATSSESWSQRQQEMR